MTQRTTDEEAIDPARSACVLIGARHYRKLPELPGVKANLRGLREALVSPDIWGVPSEHVRIVHDPRDPWDLTDPVREVAPFATDTLLIYYAGHGLTYTRDQELHLALQVSEPGHPEKSLPYEQLRLTVDELDSQPRRRIVILDCCYSGRALGGGDGRVSLTTIRGTEGAYTVASAASMRHAHSDSDEPTVFTGELLRVLNEGLPGAAGEPPKQKLSLDDIFAAVQTSLGRAGRPVPEPLDRMGVGDIPFVRNQALMARQVPPPRRLSGVQRWAAGGGLAAALAAAVGLGYGWGSAGETDTVGAGAARPPAPDSGPCGTDRAALLHVTDALDARFGEDEVWGLSGLTSPRASDPGSLLAVGDNSPGRFYRIELGEEATRPSPRVVGVQGLRLGKPGKGPFDGEGIALEKGGKTVLVASEHQPAVRRFDVESGEEKDRFPLPDQFALGAEGGAFSDRVLESLDISPDGRHMFTGLEGARFGEEDVHGSSLLRIQRYEGKPGGDYRLAGQYAVQAPPGLYLTGLVALGKDRLLAVERGYLAGAGNSVRLVELDLATGKDVSKKEDLGNGVKDYLVRSKPVVDLADCPRGRQTSPERQFNPLLQNVEGAALGARIESGPYKGRRLLYLVSDNNDSRDQHTRFYTLALRLS